MSRKKAREITRVRERGTEIERETWRKTEEILTTGNKTT